MSHPLVPRLPRGTLPHPDPSAQPTLLPLPRPPAPGSPGKALCGSFHPNSSIGPEAPHHSTCAPKACLANSNTVQQSLKMLPPCLKRGQMSGLPSPLNIVRKPQLPITPAPAWPAKGSTQTRARLCSNGSRAGLIGQSQLRSGTALPLQHS